MSTQLPNENRDEKKDESVFANTYFDKLVEKIGNILSWLYLFIVFISVYEIIARYLFNSPTKWVHETSIALAGFLMIYGGLYAYGKDKHIRVPLLLNRLSDKWRFVFELFANIIILAFVSILGYASYIIAQKATFTPLGEFHLETSGSAWDPPFPGLLKVSLFVLLLIFFIQVVWRMMSSFYRQNK